MAVMKKLIKKLKLNYPDLIGLKLQSRIISFTNILSEKLILSKLIN